MAYFDCVFSKTRGPVAFSTGPDAPYTHWKQTVFYLEEPLMVQQGEEITGRLSCTPNAGNPRDLDIKIDFEHAGVRVARAPRARLARSCSPTQS